VLISYETISRRKICKRSYTLDDLNDNEPLITVKDGTGSTVDSTGSSIRVLIGSSSNSVDREEISSCGETSSTTSDLDSGSSIIYGSGSKSSTACFLESFPRQLRSLYIQ